MKFNLLLSSLLLSVTTQTALASQSIEPIMVTIPAGSFAMGDESKNNTQALKRVSVDEFSLGKYEVTVKEFRRFIETTNYEMPKQCYHQITQNWFSRQPTAGSWQNNTINTSEYQPVNCIDFNAVEAYVQWLAKETGQPYRLPTEEEWEYAARAGTTGQYYFGEEMQGSNVCEYENVADLTGENVHQQDSGASFVNYGNSGGKANCSDHAGYASIVGMYKANPFGLHDMLSNVMEYTADCFEGKLPMGEFVSAEECKYRSLRGGDWHRNIKPVSWRPMRMADFPPGGLEGFRLALDGKATNTAQSTRDFEKQLSAIQQSEQSRRDSSVKYPAPVNNVELLKTDGIATLTWNKSQEADVSSYRVYRNTLTGGRFKLLAANITDTQFKDANANLNHPYEYTVVAVSHHQQGDYSNFLSTQLLTQANVPGRVEAEGAFDMTGSTLRFKKTSDKDTGFNVTGRGGIPADALLDYHVEVAESGHYKLSYRVSTPRDTKGFAVLINDKEATIAKIAETGGWNNWQTQNGDSVYLTKGKNKLTVKSLDNNWKLNWLELQPKS